MEVSAIFEPGRFRPRAPGSWSRFSSRVSQACAKFQRRFTVETERSIEGGGDFRHGQPREEAQLGNFREVGLLLGQPAQGFVQFNHLGRGGAAGSLLVAEGDAHPVAPAPFGHLAPGVIDEDAAHRLRRGGEEVAAIIPLERLAVGSGEFDPGFMDQGGCLQGVVAALSGHAGAGQPAQFLVDEGKELIGELSVAGSQGLQDAASHQTRP